MKRNKKKTGEWTLTGNAYDSGTFLRAYCILFNSMHEITLGVGFTKPWRGLEPVSLSIHWNFKEPFFSFIITLLNLELEFEYDKED